MVIHPRRESIQAQNILILFDYHDGWRRSIFKEFYSIANLLSLGDCGRAPPLGLATGGIRGNIQKHRSSSKCSYEARNKQLRIHEKRSSKPLTERALQSLLLNAIMVCNLPFSIVKVVEFKKLILEGLGRQHLKISSREHYYDLPISCIRI